jgi:hypothetical protein
MQGESKIENTILLTIKNNFYLNDLIYDLRCTIDDVRLTMDD